MLGPRNVQYAPKTPLIKGVNPSLYGFGYRPRFDSIEKHWYAVNKNFFNKRLKLSIVISGSWRELQAVKPGSKNPAAIQCLYLCSLALPTVHMIF